MQVEEDNIFILVWILNFLHFLNALKLWKQLEILKWMDLILKKLISVFFQQEFYRQGGKEII